MDAVNEFLGVAITEDTNQAAIVRTYGADDALLHQIDVRALLDDVPHIFGDITVEKHDQYVSVYGAAPRLTIASPDFLVYFNGNFSSLAIIGNNIKGLCTGDVLLAAVAEVHVHGVGPLVGMGPFIDFAGAFIDLPPPHPGPIFLHEVHIPGLFPVDADDGSSVELTDSDSSSDED